MTPHIFISYASIDQKLAEDLNDALSILGIKTFLDRKDIDLGVNFKARISSALEQCSDLVLIASPASLESQWVFFEVGQAVAFRHAIIVVLTHPSLTLPAFLADLQHAQSFEQVTAHFKRRLDPARQKGPIVVSIGTAPESPSASLEPSGEIRRMIDRFPPSTFQGRVAIDGALEVHKFPSQSNPYGGITYDQLSTKESEIEWSDIAVRGLSRRKRDVLGAALRSWAGDRKAQPNRIRFLVEPPQQMVLDNNEFRMHIGNSDYFSFRAVVELARNAHATPDASMFEDVFDTWKFEPGKPFAAQSVPHHLSAQGVLFVTDPTDNRKYLIITLPSRLRTPMVPGWNVTFAEQMWAPVAETPKEPWWNPYLTGLTIDAPNDRTGDRDIWATVRRGLFEELGVREEDLTTRPRLVASCIEQDLHSVAFVFVLQATLTLRQLHMRKHAAPDDEIGAIAAYPIQGPSSEGGWLDPARQFVTLLSKDHFDGGPYLLPKPGTSVVEPWHLSSRLRIHAAARHIVGAKLLDHIRLA